VGGEANPAHSHAVASRSCGSGVAPEYLALVDEQMRSVTRVDARSVVLGWQESSARPAHRQRGAREGVAGDIAVRP